MAKAVRKQLHLSAKHDRLVKDLAARWDTTEASVVQKALESLAESERQQEDRRTDKERRIDELLREAGTLGGGWTSPRLSRRQLEVLATTSAEERELLRRRTERLGGGSAVIADREERERILAGVPLDE